MKKEPSYPGWCDVNKLYGLVMSQKMPVNNFKCVEDTSQFTKDFIDKYNEDSDEGYFLEVYAEYAQNSLNLHNDLPFLPGRMKIEKGEKLVTNLHDKEEYVIHIRNLKQGLNQKLVLKKVSNVYKNHFV